jgi:hypothetical protein
MSRQKEKPIELDPFKGHGNPSGVSLGKMDAQARAARDRHPRPFILEPRRLWRGDAQGWSGSLWQQLGGRADVC